MMDTEKPQRIPVFKDSTKFEYEGKLVKSVTPPPLPQRCQLFVPHACGPACVLPYDERKDEYRRISPLQLPSHLGFFREIVESAVFYQTPCLRRLSDSAELLQFLKDTKYNLGVDYFSYDSNVDTEHKFVPTNIRSDGYWEDLSNGKETSPISVVNAFDNNFPGDFDYIKDRIPGEGVNLALDPDFLICCDCTDNCADKTKCACWKLTLEGPHFMDADLPVSEIGYVNKRLMSHMISGIYECNSKCQCKSTCFNRVAQNGLKWQLQLFKTLNKGWAIRTLHDIPIGSFICVYAGEIITEEQATEVGTVNGFEYFAGLDFIEVMGQVKANFEILAKGPGLENEDKQIKLSGSRTSDEEGQSEAFGPSDGYIIDGKRFGNIGRYFNHSCSPTVFAQTVFLDTHDLRFPWVAFFAYTHISAGTELTWNYNYEIGSVDDQVVKCLCESENCRGRLL